MASPISPIKRSANPHPMRKTKPVVRHDSKSMSVFAVSGTMASSGEATLFHVGSAIYLTSIKHSLRFPHLNSCRKFLTCRQLQPPQYPGRLQVLAREGRGGLYA